MVNWGPSRYSQVPTLLSQPERVVRDRFWRADWTGAYEVRYAAGVSVWVRWLVAALVLYILFHQARRKSRTISLKLLG